MKTIELTRKEVDLKHFVKRAALKTDFDTLITEDCMVTENGVPRILYMRLPDADTKYLRQAVKNIKYTATTRTNGLKTTSRIFGYNPRNVIRKNYCSTTSLASEKPTEHNVICSFGEYLAKLYKEYFPEVYKMHDEIVAEKMLTEWKLKDTPFTSGIVNKNNPLKYHFDAGNIKNVLSNMVVFKSGITEGYLSCPEFNIGFEVADNTVILFDGQNILHGVTPINRVSKDGYRYSIVYYTLKQMWNCLPITEEIALARSERVKRETRRANGLLDPNTLNRDKP